MSLFSAASDTKWLSEVQVWSAVDISMSFVQHVLVVAADEEAVEVAVSVEVVDVSCWRCLVTSS